MSEQADSFVNRDTPIPVVSITGPDDSTSASKTPTSNAHDASKHRISASKLKDKLESLGDQRGQSDSPSRVSDRLLTMLLSQVLPPAESSSSNDEPDIKDYRSSNYVARPSFSLPTMSSNFRRFNARIGVAFVFQNRAIRLFSWRQPTHTLSFLFIYTFVVLNPLLLPVLPVACLLFFVMVPAFLARHPPPPTHLPTDLYPLSGPPLAGARTIKPAPELSKDFFRNMRDLQNAMEDFSRVHDAILAFLTPLTNFSNEALSSVLYVLLLCTACLLFISAHLLPWRLVFLLLGYAATFAGHPAVQALLATPANADFVSEKESQGRSWLLGLSKADVELATAPEIREVEIFELQHRPLHDELAEFDTHVFSTAPYTPLSPLRIAGDRPKGTPFFEDVQPPRGWRWSDKKWTLDLLSREWVEERCVTGVEVEVEGERWVTDLWYEEVVEEDRGTKKGKLRKGVERVKLKEVPSRKGEWRRRRWVRGVERVPVSSSTE